jgi:trimeric autotransporter adhesin
MALKRVLLVQVCSLMVLGCGGGGGGGSGGKGGAAGSGLAGHGGAGSSGNAGGSGDAGNAGGSGNAGSSGNAGNLGSAGSAGAGSAGNSGGAGNGQSDAGIDGGADAHHGSPLTGSISGLVGSGLVLRNEFAAILSVPAGATSFAFPTVLAPGSAYQVTVVVQPTSPSQTCTVTNGAGSASDGGVAAGLSVTCTTNAFSVRGTVVGLTSNGMVLRDNGGDDLPIRGGETSFAFPTKVASGTAFAVTVFAPPSEPAQTCTVAGGSGQVGAGDINSVTINCATDSFTVGGSVTGLAGTVVLQDNGADSLSVTANAFAFPTPVASGQPYAVTVLNQPVSPISQTCTVTGGTGTVTAPVTNAAVTCVTNAFKVKATVNGLTGAGLKLRNGTDVVPVSASGVVTVSAAVASGSAYTVSVDTQPSGQLCAVVAPIGTISTADVAVTVNCGDALHAVRGTISGVVGDVLLQNGADVISVGNGSFAFPSDLTTGSAYSVSVATPLSDCTLTNGSGTIAAADATVTIACRSPLAYYFPFDGNAVDHSGNGHDGMVNGATLVADRFGTPKSAYSFDGTAWIEAVGDSLPTGNSDRTLTLWMNPSSGNAVSGIVAWGQQNCTGNMWGFGYLSSAVFWGGCDDFTSGLLIPAGTWSFVALRFTGPNHLHLRINGQTADVDLAANPNTMASALWIGAQTATNQAADFSAYYYGALDSIRIYDRALTDAEIDSVQNKLP